MLTDDAMWDDPKNDPPEPYWDRLFREFHIDIWEVDDDDERLDIEESSLERR